MTAIDNDHYSHEYQMVWTLLDGPGYHTTMPKGAKVHPTRESTDYALELLTEGGIACIARASGIC